MRAPRRESGARGRERRGRRGRGATVARSASATAPPRTNDERVRRMPRGRPPLSRRWDESVGAWVLDEAGEALERRQLELPPLASRPDDLNAWAVANPPPRREDFATQELLDEAREYPGTRCCWASGYRRTARTPSVRRRGVWPAYDTLSARCPTTSRRRVPRHWEQRFCCRRPTHRKTFRVRASAAAACAGRLGRASSSDVSRRSWDKVTAY